MFTKVYYFVLHKIVQPMALGSESLFFCKFTKNTVFDYYTVKMAVLFIICYTVKNF